MLKDAIQLFTPLVAISALVIVELQALNHNIDGMVFTAVIGAICGLGGYSLPAVVAAIRKPKK